MGNTRIHISRQQTNQDTAPFRQVYGALLEGIWYRRESKPTQREVSPTINAVTIAQTQYLVRFTVIVIAGAATTVVASYFSTPQTSGERLFLKKRLQVRVPSLN